MKFVVTGAGQVGRQVVAHLVAQGHDVIVLRRPGASVPGARTVQADAGDQQVLARELVGAAAVFHCIHAAYDPVAWRRELPERERAVMDAAAEAGVPVVFPESVYAFGRDVTRLLEGAAPNPCSPLGQVRAELLDARRSHPAVTVSVVAGDLVGSGTTAKGSVPTATVVERVRQGRTAWVMGDPDVPHAMTVVADLARAMVTVAAYPDVVAPDGDAVLNAPSPESISMRELARSVAEPGTEPTVRAVPWWPLRALGAVSPATRSLWHQRYLWDAPSVLEPGVLTTELGLAATQWSALGLSGG